jgi:L-threonylcarbamoyladenylate synthase
MKNQIYIYPTDTVWGIGGNAFKEETYIRISQIKQTAVSKPLSILFSSTEMLSEYVDLSKGLYELIDDLKEHEITFGLDKKLFKNQLPEVAFGTTDFVCVRVLGGEIIENIINEVDAPITTTSLNITGQPPITEVDDAKDFWKKYASEELMVTADFKNDVTGNSSTIVILSGNEYKVLREGNRMSEITQRLNSFLQRHD